MKLETTQVINGIEVIDTDEKLMGHRLFTEKDENHKLILYVIDSKGCVKATIKVTADCGQNTGYVDGWEVKNF